MITLSHIGNPVNHLSELLHCSPSHTIGQQRQDQGFFLSAGPLARASKFSARAN